MTSPPVQNAPSSIRVGALDVAPMLAGTSPAEVLENSLRLARRLEALGYSRLWFAEHHAANIAHSCPELLVALAAGLTGNLRIGTAGILLRLHSSLRVAKVFRALSVLYPNRIDLGIARGGAEKPVEALLRDGSQTDVAFEDKVGELLKMIRGATDVVVNPASPCLPEVWMLGSNLRSMAIAAEEGTAFCFARFLPKGGANTAETIASYRRSFRPSAELSLPACSIAVAGICAETDEQARALLPAETILSAFPNIVGGPATWRRELELLQQQAGVDEFVLLDLCPSFAARERSFELIAEALHLRPGSATPAPGSYSASFRGWESNPAPK